MKLTSTALAAGALAVPVDLAATDFLLARNVGLELDTDLLTQAFPKMRIELATCASPEGDTAWQAMPLIRIIIKLCLN